MYSACLTDPPRNSYAGLSVKDRPLTEGKKGTTTEFDFGLIVLIYIKWHSESTLYYGFMSWTYCAIDMYRLVIMQPVDGHSNNIIQY